MTFWKQVFKNSWHWFAFLYLISCAKPIAHLVHFGAASPITALLFPLGNLIPSLILFALPFLLHAYKNKTDPSFTNTSFFKRNWSYISAASLLILILGQIRILEDLQKG
jgi:hypothetical protein